MWPLGNFSPQNISLNPPRTLPDAFIVLLQKMKIRPCRTATILSKMCSASNKIKNGPFFISIYDPLKMFKMFHRAVTFV